MTAHPRPTEIQLHQQSRFFEIHYEDGAHFLLPYEYLRVYSPSAEVRGHAPEEAVLQIGKERVNIQRLEPVGNYALKIYFDDGHNSGLFDWAYLYRLGRAWQPLWQDYLKRLEEAGHGRTAPDPFRQLQEAGKKPAQLPEQQD